MKICDLDEMENADISPSYLRKIFHGDSLTLAKVEVQEGEVTQRHSHESEEIIFVLQGAWTFHLPEGEVTVRSNQLLCIPAGVEHSSEAIEDTVALDICSKLRPDWLTGLDKGLHSNPAQSLWGV